MSIFTKIGGFFSKVGALPGGALKVLEAAWNAVKSVWSFLTGSYQILDAAWTWVVNGAEWFAGQVGGWAGEVFHTLWDTLTSTIPKAIAWVFNQAVHWAAVALHKVYNEIRGWVKSIYAFLVRLIHDLVNAVKGLLHTFIKWATNPIRWVLHWGAWLIHLITHPENIANWIASAVVEPVVKWLLRAGAHVVVWALRAATRRDSEFAHLIENVLHDLL